MGREALLVFESLDRLVGFLGAYSREANLDDLVPTLTLERARRTGGGQTFLLRCQAVDGYALDRLMRLAKVTQSPVYAGSGAFFIQTRDRRAPFGYDLEVSSSEIDRADDVDVLVVEFEFSMGFSIIEGIDPVELILQLALRPVPLPRGGVAEDPELAGVREMALLLVAPGISERVLSYLWRVEADMAGVRVQIEEDARSSLLVRLRQPDGHLLDILRAIPGVELLAPVSPRAAVEVGYEHPIHLASVGRSLPGDDMYILRGGVGRVERMDGAPRFVQGRHLVASEVQVRDWAPRKLAVEELAPLRVELELRATAHAREPRASLVAWRDIELLRRLVYVVPPSALAAARVVALEEGLLVVSGAPRAAAERGSDQGFGVGSIIPLGDRLVEIAPGVLVPDGYELWPRVRASLIRELLGLDGDDRVLFRAPGLDPIRVPADEMIALDAAVVGSLQPVDLEAADVTVTDAGPGTIENQSLGRFALWGFKSQEGGS